MDSAQAIVDILRRNGLPVDKTHIRAFVLGWSELMRVSLANTNAKAQQAQAEEQAETKPDE